MKLRPLLPLLPVLGLMLAGTPAHAAELLVFAAASLRTALDAADAAYQKEAGTKVVASYAASGPLAKQIENGAPADLFISADSGWMDYVAQRTLIKPATRSDLLGNRLVLVGPKDATQIELRPGFDLAARLGGGRLALGDPNSVPAGAYGKAALTKLGLWESLQGKLAPTADVRQALALVSRGEAPLGIVYQTDVAADPGVTVVGVFPPDSYPPIVYPIAELASTSKPEADRYLAWLRSPAAAVFFEQQGFTRLP